LIVLSAGALSTPQILQRSGIGSSANLSSLGIRSISNLPSVGANYLDHNNCLGGSSRIEGGPDDTGDLIARGDPATLAPLMQEFASGKGPLAWNFVDAGAKLNPSPADLLQMGPAFQAYWNEFFAKNPDKPSVTMALLAMYPPF
jgi:alcohol oxidase